jgi:uncharacterized membrane protein YfcA
MDHPAAVMTSLTAVFVTGSSSTVAYARQGRVDYLAGLTMAGGMIPGVLVGARITRALDPGAFQVLFGVVMGVMAALMIRRILRPLEARPAPGDAPRRGRHRELVESDGTRHEYRLQLPLLALAAMMAGAASAALGIGGGLVLVPVLVALIRVPVHVATATSTFVMIPMSLLGIVVHGLAAPHVDWAILIGVGAGVLLGAQAGAAASKRFRPRSLTYVVAIGVTLLAVVLVYRGLR